MRSQRRSHSLGAWHAVWIGVLVLMLRACTETSVAAQPCDSSAFAYNRAGAPVVTATLVNELPDRFTLYVRPFGDAEWTATATLDCKRYETGNTGRLDPNGEPWCALDTIGVPLTRWFDLEPEWLYEVAATVWEGGVESNKSNIVEVCWPPTCDPAVDPASCADPGEVP